MHGREWSPGCGIILPICSKTSTWIGSAQTKPADWDDTTASNSYTQCGDWPLSYKLPVFDCFILSDRWLTR